MLGAIGAAAIVVLYFVFIASSQPKMVVAFSGLAAEDTASMVDELESSGIKYEIGGGGSTLSVPANKVAEVRIKLAQAGLGAGSSVGLEIFDETNFGATDFVQKVNFRRGLEGELARSINTLDGVRASRVHLSIPESAIFIEDQVDPTASVLLQLKPGTRLNEEQVRGITNLVTNTVEGLEHSGVTIIDDSGRVLYDGAVSEGMFSSGGTATQMDLQRQYELSLQRDVTDTLARVVGPGRSAVTVRARLNFDQVTSQQQEFGTADQSVPRSQTTTEETFVGNNLTVGTVPGTDGNTGVGAANTANGGSDYSRTETTTNWEIPQVSSTTVRAPGSVERLSVSVVLDESISPAQEAAITSAVAAAVGLDQTRGDQLSVTRLPFDESVVNDLVGVAGNGLESYLSYLKLLLPILAIVLGFILVMLLLRSLSKRQFAFLPTPMQPQLASGFAPGVAALAALPNGQENLPALQQASDPHEERVLKLAEANPRAVANVVQTWMREGD